MRTELKVKVKVLGFHFNEPFSMIEVFGNEKKEVKLDNPFSLDQCSISSVSLYTAFVLHNVPTD